MAHETGIRGYTLESETDVLAEDQIEIIIEEAYRSDFPEDLATIEQARIKSDCCGIAEESSDSSNLATDGIMENKATGEALEAVSNCHTRQKGQSLKLSDDPKIHVFLNSSIEVNNLGMTLDGFITTYGGRRAIQDNLEFGIVDPSLSIENGFKLVGTPKSSDDPVNVATIKAIFGLWINKRLPIMRMKISESCIDLTCLSTTSVAKINMIKRDAPNLQWKLAGA